MAREKPPQILTASDLLEGEPVFYAASGWTADHRAAQIARTPDEEKVLEAAARAAIAENRVVDAVLIDVALTPAGPEPTHYRERIRTLGPTVRRDLGPQAEQRP